MLPRFFKLNSTTVAYTVGYKAASQVAQCSSRTVLKTSLIRSVAPTERTIIHKD